MTVSIITHMYIYIYIDWFILVKISEKCKSLECYPKLYQRTQQTWCYSSCSRLKLSHPTLLRLCYMYYCQCCCYYYCHSAFAYFIIPIVLFLCIVKPYQSIYCPFLVFFFFSYFSSFFLFLIVYEETNNQKRMHNLHS